MDWRQHSRRPGMPPPPRPKGITADDVEPIPCEACACVFRKIVEALKHMRLRICEEQRPAKIADVVQTWYLCIGCGAQVDTAGALVPLTSPDRIPVEVLKEVTRA